MCPAVTRYSARLGVVKWDRSEILVLAEEPLLPEVLDKLKQMKENFSLLDILILNLGSSLEIRQRLKSDGNRVFTVDTRGKSWSTLEEAREEVWANHWRLGSSAIHDEVGLEIMRMLEEGLESYDFQVNVCFIKTLKNP